MEAQGKDILGTILARRTTPKFLSKDVAQATIDQLMQAAMFAPTRLGLRPWQFLVIRQPALMAELATTLRLEPDYGKAPIYIAILGEKSTSEAWDLDGGAAAENLLVAATALGLGSAWIASPVNPLWDKFEGVLAKAAKLPKDLGLVAVLALGYPAEAQPAHTEAEVYEQHRVHFETWGATQGK